MEAINVLELPGGFTQRCRRCRKRKAKFVRDMRAWREVGDVCWSCATADRPRTPKGPTPTGDWRPCAPPLHGFAVSTAGQVWSFEEAAVLTAARARVRWGGRWVTASMDALRGAAPPTATATQRGHLVPELVVAIRWLRRRGYALTVIGEAVGIDHSQVSRIATGRLYAGVRDDDYCARTVTVQ